MRTVYRADPTNSLHALFLLCAALELLYDANLYFTDNYCNVFLDLNVQCSSHQFKILINYKLG